MEQVSEKTPLVSDDARSETQSARDTQKAKQRAVLDFVNDLQRTIPTGADGKPDINAANPQVLIELCKRFMGEDSLSAYIEAINEKISAGARRPEYSPAAGQKVTATFGQYMAKAIADSDKTRGDRTAKENAPFVAWLVVTAALAISLTYLTYDFYTGTGRNAGQYLSDLIYSVNEAINSTNMTMPQVNETADYLKILFDTAGIPPNSLLNTYGTWLPVITFWTLLFDRFPGLRTSRWADADKIALMTDENDHNRGKKLAGKAILVTLFTVAPCVTYAATAAADGDPFFTAMLVGASNFASFFLGLSKLVDRISLRYQPAYRKVVWQYLETQKDELLKLYQNSKGDEKIAMEKMMSEVVALSEKIDELAEYSDTDEETAKLSAQLFAKLTNITNPGIKESDPFTYYSTNPIPGWVSGLVGLTVVLAVGGTYGFIGATYLGTFAALAKYGKPVLGQILGAIASIISLPGFGGLSWTAADSMAYGVYNKFAGKVTVPDLIDSKIIKYPTNVVKLTVGGVTTASGGTNAYFNGLTLDWLCGAVMEAKNYLPILFGGVALGLFSAPLTNVYYTLLAIDLISTFLAKNLPSWKLDESWEDVNCCGLGRVNIAKYLNGGPSREFKKRAQLIEALESSVVEMLKTDMADKHFRDFLVFAVNLRNDDGTPTMAAKALVSILNEKLSDAEKGQLKKDTGIDINLYMKNPEFNKYEKRYEYEDIEKAALEKARVESLAANAKKATGAFGGEAPGAVLMTESDTGETLEEWTEKRAARQNSAAACCTSFWAPVAKVVCCPVVTVRDTFCPPRTTFI